MFTRVRLSMSIKNLRARSGSYSLATPVRRTRDKTRQELRWPLRWKVEFCKSQDTPIVKIDMSLPPM